MDRARTVVCSVLPALLLLAAGHCFAERLTECGDGCRGLCLSTGHLGHAVPVDARASGQWARLASRRLMKPWGASGPAVSVPPSTDWVRESDAIKCPLVEHDGPAGLAQSWRFFWRTAAEPRAPSSVS